MIKVGGYPSPIGLIVGRAFVDPSCEDINIALRQAGQVEWHGIVATGWIAGDVVDHERSGGLRLECSEDSVVAIPGNGIAGSIVATTDSAVLINDGRYIGLIGDRGCVAGSSSREGVQFVGFIIIATGKNG